MVDMRIIKNLLFLLIFIASTLQVPAFCKYAPEFGARIDLYGTVEQISAIPDPGRNDYPTCLYAVKVKVHSADRQLGDDTAIVVIPVLKNGKLLPENLQKAKKDTLWVQKVLHDHGATLADTWLLTVDQADRVVFYRKEI